eukprot:scaffold137_cov398-Prasinococcus_capsulatus_cf.AAC.63
MRRHQRVQQGDGHHSAHVHQLLGGERLHACAAYPCASRSRGRRRACRPKGSPPSPAHRPPRATMPRAAGAHRGEAQRRTDRQMDGWRMQPLGTWVASLARRDTLRPVGLRAPQPSAPTRVESARLHRLARRPRLRHKY